MADPHFLISIPTFNKVGNISYFCSAFSSSLYSIFLPYRITSLTALSKLSGFIFWPLYNSALTTIVSDIFL
jgi:hypothetical protein